MGRGIGKTQQRILDVLDSETDQLALTMVDLAKRLQASPRQIRAAVYALAGRGLLVLTKESDGWRDYGKAGRAVAPTLAMGCRRTHRVHRQER